MRHLTSGCAWDCSARLSEHTGDSGRATRPVARPLNCTTEGAFVVNADVQLRAMMMPEKLN